ncbi:twin-arginine translocase TatA/TatE family subunit [Pararhodobacter sp.]|uniref:twin-arginine translocase TatA/TatE family subunit n=1 Tax=Pararhodobacter sp. TaxID=2127056 RepID=UPI002FDCCD4C
MVTTNMVAPLFINNAGPWGLLLIAVVVLVLFGRGKIAGLMGEVGKGITAFKKGVKDSSEEIENKNDDLGAEAARDVTPTRDRDNV